MATPSMLSTLTTAKPSYGTTHSGWKKPPQRRCNPRRPSSRKGVPIRLSGVIRIAINGLSRSTPLARLHGGMGRGGRTQVVRITDCLRRASVQEDGNTPTAVADPVVQPMDSTRQGRHATGALSGGPSGAEPRGDGFEEVEEEEAPAHLKSSRSSMVMRGEDMSRADAAPQSAKGSRRSQSLRHASFGGAKAVVQHDRPPLTGNRTLEQQEAPAEPPTWPDDISDADDVPRRSPDKPTAPAFSSRTSRSSKSLRHAVPSVSRQREEEGDPEQVCTRSLEACSATPSHGATLRDGAPYST